MNRTVQTLSFKCAMPALALGAVLMLLGPTAALAQRGGGGRGGHSGGSFSGRSFSGGGGRRDSAPSYSGRSYSGGGRSYAAPYAGRSYSSGGRSYAAPYAGRSYGGGHYGGGGGYYPGRFYSGQGYYYGGRFWARPYFGIGIGIPFGWGYNSGSGCGYYDGYGYWQPAPCYPTPSSGYWFSRCLRNRRARERRGCPRVSLPSGGFSSHKHEIFCNPFPPNRLPTKSQLPATPFLTPLGVKSNQGETQGASSHRQFHPAHCGENPQSETNLSRWMPRTLLFSTIVPQEVRHACLTSTPACERLKNSWTIPSRWKPSARPTALFRPSRASISKSAPAKSSACSAPTAPVRPPPSKSSRGCAPALADASASWAATPRCKPASSRTASASASRPPISRRSSKSARPWNSSPPFTPAPWMATSS